eukprot:3040834-Rhodomonas_salina.1
MQDACARSLSLTEGKVTELTPAPIPECLAAAFQVRFEIKLATTVLGCGCVSVISRVVVVMGAGRQDL